jgi:hypothetical protein
VAVRGYFCQCWDPSCIWKIIERKIYKKDSFQISEVVKSTSDNCDRKESPTIRGETVSSSSFYSLLLPM